MIIRMTAKPEYDRNQYGYIIVPVTKEMNAEAESRAFSLGPVTGSIRNGMGNRVGYIGQIAVRDAIGGMKELDTRDFDLVYEGTTPVEVKTKDRTVPPKPHYECSVAEMNHSQNASFYVFVSVTRLSAYNRVASDYNTAFILGYMQTSEYLQTATHMKIGDRDPSNNFTVRANCYNLPIRALNRFW